MLIRFSLDIECVSEKTLMVSPEIGDKNRNKIQYKRYMLYIAQKTNRMVTYVVFKSPKNRKLEGPIPFNPI